MEQARGVAGELSTKKAVSEFCLVFAKIPLQLVIRETGRMKKILFS